VGGAPWRGLPASARRGLACPPNSGLPHWQFPDPRFLRPVTLSNPVSTEDRIRAALEEHNSEFFVRAWVAFVVGTVTSMILLFFFVMVCLGCLGIRHWFIAALLAFAAASALGIWMARRHGDPASGMTGDEPGGTTLTAITWMTTGVPVSPAAGVKSVWLLAMHGPYCFVDGLSMLRSRIDADGPTLHAASRLLEELMTGDSAAVESVRPPRAAFVLLLLGLAKVDKRRADPPSVVITAKGQDAVVARR